MIPPLTHVMRDIFVFGVLHASYVLLFWEIGCGAHSFAAYRGLGTQQHSLWALLGDKE